MAAAGVVLEKKLAERKCPTAPSPISWQGGARQRSARVPVAMCPESHVMVTCGKAESQSEATLLRLVETLVQRFLGVSQTPQ
jgi:hypothetical protein